MNIKLSRIFRGRGKGLLIWAALLLIIGAFAFQDFCKGQGASFCQALQNNSTLIVFLAPVVVALMALLQALRAGRQPHTFKTHPADFHDKVITLSGRIVYILPDSVFEKAKRKVTDIYRTAMDDDDPANRYIHQRFLISSPQLKWRQRLLVEHNVKFGKVPIAKGKRVEVRGVYLHTVSKKRGHFYGRIHFTHAPQGYIEIL